MRIRVRDLEPGMENFGSGINISNPQHWQDLMRIYYYGTYYLIRYRNSTNIYTNTVLYRNEIIKHYYQEKKKLAANLDG